MLICFIFLFIIGRYLLYPILFQPKLDFKKTFDFLETQNCKYINYRQAKQIELIKYKEQNSLAINNLFFVFVLYRVVAKGLDDNKHTIFWVEIQSRLNPFIKNKVQFREEKDNKLLDELNKEISTKVIIIEESCPACHNKINDTDKICSDCGLILK